MSEWGFVRVGFGPSGVMSSGVMSEWGFVQWGYVRLPKNLQALAWRFVQLDLVRRYFLNFQSVTFSYAM